MEYVSKNMPTSSEKNIRAWFRGEIPSWLVLNGSFQEENFMKWAKATVTKGPILTCLKDLHTQYAILPSTVLNILGRFWVDFYCDTSVPEELLERLRTRRKRETSSNRIDKAIKEIKIWEPLLRWHKLLRIPTTNHKIAIAYLYRAKMIIRNIQSIEHRSEEIKRRRCAQTLLDFFTATTRRPRLKDTEMLMTQAFPDQCFQPKSDKARVASDWAKGPHPKRRPVLKEAILLHTKDRPKKRIEIGKQTGRVGIALKIRGPLAEEAAKREKVGKDATGEAGGRGKKKNPTPKSGEGLGESAEHAASTLSHMRL